MPATPRIELVVTDLDGTLWEEPTHVPKRTRDALAALDRMGIPLLVATGRRIASTREPLASIGISPPAVVLNGALGLELDTGSRFHIGGFDPDDAAAVLEVFMSHDVEPCVYVNAESPAVFVGHAPSTHPDHLASFGDDVVADDLVAVVGAEAVLAFGVLGMSAEAAEGLGRQLAAVATPHVAADRQYDGYTVTVAPSTQSKWDGVLAFCRRQGISADAVLAIGDGPNDVELLDHAAVAVVPEDAHQDALSHARHVVGRAADGGWADLLDLL